MTDTQPATPGSYGEAPVYGRLPAATRLGPVQLQVAELDRALAFYTRVLGFRVLRQDAIRADLTAATDPEPIITLHARPGARPMTARGRLGLFHIAYLLPDRAALGRFVRHLAALGMHPGASDHLVSEALYLTDPDGLGIEVYADRPRDTWHRIGRELVITTEPLDLRALLRAGGDAPWDGMPAGTTVGHVHLHVGDIARGAAFYGDALGFDRMTWRYPGALFLGAGGYHHHVGTNVWAGSDARAPEAGDARLLEWTILVPHATDVAATVARLARAGADHALVDDPAQPTGVVAHDPWGTTVRIRSSTPLSHSAL